MKKLLIILIAILTISCSGNAQKTIEKKQKSYKVTHTDNEWKEILTPEQYYVLRQEGTERSFSSPLNNIKVPGTFYCAGCNTPLYQSKHKFDSGTGWPSFDRSVEGNVSNDTDHKLGYVRTELVCNTCGGHLGHVFNDGPKETTGQRHCINGNALIFKQKK